MRTTVRHMLAITAASSLVSVLCTLGLQYRHTYSDELPLAAAPLHQTTSYASSTAPAPTQLTRNTENGYPSFIQAAKLATRAVVHVECSYEMQSRYRSGSPLEQLFQEFFGEDLHRPRSPERSAPEQKRYSKSMGSGVIVDADGYIVTNHHVVEGAKVVEVTLDDNRKYTAQVIGQDAATDLALLKIEEKALPHLVFGDSDALQVGEWVLAVGNPFNLTSTVTKGIVSAKARNISTPLEKPMRIEAFIQTDAAVNSGNSGGALITLDGALVGINTAIATRTGTFAGYSFAIPSSIVRKVVEDLRQHGSVRRGMLGISTAEINAEFAKQKKLSRVSGLYVAEIVAGGAASETDLQVGDIITAINDRPVKSFSQLQEQLVRCNPGDQVKLTFYRKKVQKQAVITLKDPIEKPQVVRTANGLKIGGATLEDLKPSMCKELKIACGVRVAAVGAGHWKKAGVRPGFVITAVDRVAVKNLDQMAQLLSDKSGGMLLEGFYQPGHKVYYGIDLSR